MNFTSFNTIHQKQSIPKNEFELLIVDDDQIIRTLVAGFAKNIGIRKIQMASNGEDAFQLMKEKKIHLILMDNDMSEENEGVKTTKKYRKTEKATRVPIVSISSFSSDPGKFEKAGMDGMRPKPLSPQSLEEVLIHFYEFV